MSQSPQPATEDGPVQVSPPAPSDTPTLASPTPAAEQSTPAPTDAPAQPTADVDIKDATPPPPPPPVTSAPQPDTAPIPTDDDDQQPSPASPAQPQPPKRSAEEEEQEQAEKKRKLEKVRTESKARGNRMFGVMLGTLRTAKKQVGSIKQTDAGRKRAEIEEKLQEKLGKERREAIDKESKEREARDLKNEIVRREEEIAAADTIYRTRHNAKLDLAGFLCTTFTPPPSASTPSSDGISTPFLPRLPHATSLTGPSSSSPRPIFYLPARLLPSQEDRIEDQIDLVKQAMRKDRDEWEEVKKDKVRLLEEARRRRDERGEEMQRREREERQRRRREQEDKEDREREEERSKTRERSMAAMAVDEEEGAAAREKSARASLPPPPPRRSASPGPSKVSEAVKEAEEGDVAMKEDKVIEASEAPVELSAASALDLAPAEEELEY